VRRWDTKKKREIPLAIRPAGPAASARRRCPLGTTTFSRPARGVVIPHGLYDLALNEGYLHWADSHETSRFAADALFITGKLRDASATRGGGNTVAVRRRRQQTVRAPISKRNSSAWRIAPG